VGRVPRPDGIDYGVFIDYDPASKKWTIALFAPDLWKWTNVRITSEMGVSELGLVGFSLPPPGVGIAPVLYLNSGGTFFDSTAHAGLNDPNRCESVTASDFDNDMDVDIYLACSDTAINRPNALYENLGEGVFRRVPDAGGAAGSSMGLAEAVVSADYDQDGCVDLFVTNGNWMQPFYNGPHQLFHNNCSSNGNHWLEIDLEGVISNRDGIGAKVVATAGGVTQVRMAGSMHLFSQNHQRIHFGLGPNERVDEIKVYWPNGLVQQLSNVAADQLLYVLEDTRPSIVGKPRYIAGRDDGVYLWKDAGESGYHLRISAPDSSSSTYEVKLIANVAPLSVVPVKLEREDSFRRTSKGFVLVAHVGGGEDGIDFRLPADAEAMLSVEKDGVANPRLLHVGADGLPVAPAGWIKQAASLSVRPQVDRGNELGLSIGKNAAGTKIEARWSGDGNRDQISHYSRFRVMMSSLPLAVAPVFLEGGDRFERTVSSVSVAGAVANGWDGLDFTVASDVEVGFTFEQDGLLPPHHVNNGALGDLGFPNAYWITGRD
jgi:hypothetical protein